MTTQRKHTTETMSLLVYHEFNYVNQTQTPLSINV